MIIDAHTASTLSTVDGSYSVAGSLLAEPLSGRSGVERSGDGDGASLGRRSFGLPLGVAASLRERPRESTSSSGDAAKRSGGALPCANL